MKCPPGNTSLWFEKLYKISQNYSQIILLSACKHSEAFAFLYSIYYPSMTYAFSTLHLEESELNNIGQSALNSILRKGMED